MLDLGLLLAKLVFFAVQEYIRAIRQAEEREESERFELDQIRFRAIIFAALNRLKLEAKADSDQARRIEDQVDQELSKRKKEE